ncbi:putative ABC transport system permease protein [Motilibacter peucedani]|uniref:Putative ABC transport system permease protein n=1 Tax=Motilibacter peucedani TaxID=598650 RepID=A0A420XPK1_9ACTN|nr:FtsX-like permease family protein [Motilibacter peucedani]RKS74123.1 putative ABC transport system permease protein [Motilibacter peucedani]
MSRRPRFAVGLALLTALLVAVGVSAPLLVAAAGEGAWEQDRDRLGTTTLGATVLSGTRSRFNGSVANDRVAQVPALDAALDAQAKALGLPAPVELPDVTGLLATGAGRVEKAQVFARTEAEARLELLSGGPATTGVLVPSRLATALSLRAGGTLQLRATDLTGHPRSVALPVAGVYREPALPVGPYWEGQAYRFFVPLPNPRTGDLDYPEAPVVAAPALVRSVATSLEQPVDLEYAFPLPSHASRAQAEAAAVRQQQLTLRVGAPPLADRFDAVGEPALVRTSLANVLTRTRSTVSLLTPPVRAVGYGGAGAALLLVGVWAAQRVRRREVQLRALVARGLSPAQAGWRAAVEALPAVVVGTLLGAGAGAAAVRALGPAGRFPEGWLGDAWPVVVVCALLVLVEVAVVTAVAVARMGQIGVGAAQQLLGRVPWVPVTAAVAVVAALPLVDGRPRDDGGLGVVTLGVPLLVVAAASGVVVSVLQRAARPVRGPAARLPAGAYLGVRRVLAAASATRLVVVATAVALGLVVYAGALAASTSRTLHAKAVVAVGADYVADVNAGHESPALPAGATLVQRARGIDLAPGGLSTDVLAVDPAGFGRVADWEPGFADRPLPELLAALVPRAGAADRVPVVVAGPVPDQVLTSTGGRLTLDFGAYQVQAQVVGRASAFPGMPSTRPMLVAARAPLTAALHAAGQDIDLVLQRQVWGRGDDRPLLQASGPDTTAVDPAAVRTTSDFLARPALRAQSWTLGYLRAVAACAGVLGLAGLALYAAAQQRRRTVASVLLDRMGLARRSALAAAAVELGLLALVAAVLGAGLGLPTARLVLDTLDPVPALPPGPVFEVPLPALLAVAVGVVLLVAVGSVLVDSLARRAPRGQVLRGG